MNSVRIPHDTPDLEVERLKRFDRLVRKTGIEPVAGNWQQIAFDIACRLPELQQAKKGGRKITNPDKATSPQQREALIRREQLLLAEVAVIGHDNPSYTIQKQYMEAKLSESVFYLYRKKHKRTWDALTASVDSAVLIRGLLKSVVGLDAEPEPGEDEWPGELEDKPDDWPD